MPADIIAIDNGSSDDSVDFIRNNYPGVDLIACNKNLGFGKANNLGIKKAFDNGADFVFLLNQDARIDKSALEKLVDTAGSNPQYGILSPVQLNGQGTALDVNFSRIVSDYFTPGFTNDLYMGSLKPVYDTKFVMAAMWLVSKECYKKTGLFEPLFPHYGEDSDYINRAAYHGIKTGICTASTGYHDREDRFLSKKKTGPADIYNTFLVTALNINIPGASALRNGYFTLIKELSKAFFSGDFSAARYLMKGLFLLPGILKARKKNASAFSIK